MKCNLPFWRKGRGLGEFVSMSYYLDIDECRDGSHACQENATCINTAGHYNCSCKPGFTGDGRMCLGNMLTIFIKNIVIDYRFIDNRDQREKSGQSKFDCKFLVGITSSNKIK